MSTIRASHRHSLSRSEARAVAEKIARRYEQRLGVRSRWEDDVLHFEREGATGRIVVGEDAVRVIVKLGMMLWPMKGQIRQALETHLRESFG